MQFAP